MITNKKPNNRKLDKKEQRIYKSNRKKWLDNFVITIYFTLKLDLLGRRWFEFWSAPGTTSLSQPLIGVKPTVGKDISLFTFTLCFFKTKREYCLIG